MSTFLKILVPLWVVIMTGSAALADDLALITLENRYQADVVAGVVDRAYARMDNSFVVRLDAQQKLTLERAGIGYDILKAEAETASMYLIRPRQAAVAARADVRQLGDTYELDADMLLLTTGRAASSSLADGPDYFVTPLEDLSIRITYISESVARLLTMVEDFPTDSVVARVSLDSLYAFVTRLEAFETRYIYTDSILAARDWIAGKFLGWGYTEVSMPSLFYNGTEIYNVRAVKQGWAEPDKVIVVGGHYDSITYGQSPGPLYYAPGADDDGSGTAVVLEMARILADIPLRKTIIFEAFTAEEVGLVGSSFSAGNFVADGTDLEVMFNFDMVAFTANDVWDIDVSSGIVSAYRDMTIDAGNRVTSLTPLAVPPGTSSDHAPFMQQGFSIVDHIESDFNILGWHTNLDNADRLNFEYFTEVVKMAAASITYVAEAASVTEIERIVDIGDGQSLEIFWSSCMPEYQYTLYWGTAPGDYTHSVVIPYGNCSWVVDGLTEGVLYYFMVLGDLVGGYPALHYVEGSEMPLVVPRPPQEVVAEPDFNQIILDWADNPEGDLRGYQLYRSISGLTFILYQENLQESYFVDTQVEGQTNYRYKISAVDFDGYQSEYSEEVNSYAATFDGGILLADETSTGNPLPSQEEQELMFDSLFGQTPYTLTEINWGDRLTRSMAGQFSSIFWIDDDLSPKVIHDSEDTLRWYSGWTGNIFICGFNTIWNWTASPVESEHFLYTDFGIAGYTQNSAFDFAGATGLAGWPSVVIDQTNPFGSLPNTAKIDVRPGATVIYTWDSFIDDPAFEGEPCGVVYETPNGIRVYLTFPLYFLTDATAEAVISHAKQLFGEAAVIEVNGDVDGSGIVDITDLVYLIDYVFGGGPVPVSMNSADVDASCEIDISDITYLVSYYFQTGSPPQAGCVE
jgi:hypothetical protein